MWHGMSDHVYLGFRGTPKIIHKYHAINHICYTKRNELFDDNEQINVELV